MEHGRQTTGTARAQEQEAGCICLNRKETNGAGGGSCTSVLRTDSAIYRSYVAHDAKNPTNAVDHCPVLPAGFRPERTQPLTSTALSEGCPKGRVMKWRSWRASLGILWISANVSWGEA